ncbi:MAG: hypothetical protein HQK54_07160 [Oligoflexales bacterium]|nr:hypothetical protein [Oligoflexales bacterium]
MTILSNEPSAGKKFYSYDGIARLVVRRSLWHLIFTFRILKISRSEVVLSLDQHCAESEIGISDLEFLFKTGDEYTLQLDDRLGALPSAVLQVSLIKCETWATGALLHLSILKQNDDITFLLDDLERSREKIQK